MFIFRNKLKVVWRFWCGFYWAGSELVCVFPAFLAKGSTGQQPPPCNGTAPGKVGENVTARPWKSSPFWRRRRATQYFGSWWCTFLPSGSSEARNTWGQLALISREKHGLSVWDAAWTTEFGGSEHWKECFPPSHQSPLSTDLSRGPSAPCNGKSRPTSLEPWRNKGDSLWTLVLCSWSTFIFFHVGCGCPGSAFSANSCGEQELSLVQHLQLLLSWPAIGGCGCVSVRRHRRWLQAQTFGQGCSHFAPQH